MKNTLLRKSFKILEELQIKAPPHPTLSHLPGFDFQVYALLLRIRRINTLSTQVQQQR
jgi:hypothetical protein